MIEITFSGWSREQKSDSNHFFRLGTQRRQKSDWDHFLKFQVSSFKFPGGGRNHFFETLFAKKQKVIQKSDSSFKFQT